ncbi:hypothetical protein BDN72DRAFT_902368 [Pluteus cervinus]|uniref:Uncharacterized protein n=1 Tax=Pluteus cervinus TaxID=181527 RepID=A0ACD3ADL9_9AGAR|nr:hypothetical protein BDN72DRAFT_902368 [Pluteus cervinus]
MTSPPLPPELEQIIFTLALENHLKDQKNLIFVAWRVYHWLVPLIFRVVLLHSNRALPIKFNKAVYERHGHYTQHLLLEPDYLCKYLYLFPNVRNLALWTDNAHLHLDSLKKLPLTHLSISPLYLKPPSFELFQVFSNLTHLDLVSVLSAWTAPRDHLATFKELLYLPKLTHLCVSPRFSIHGIELFLDRKRCGKLRVVIVCAFIDGDTYLEDEIPWGIEDQRVLNLKCHSIRDWEVGARGGTDMWTFADDILASRSDEMNW